MPLPAADDVEDFVSEVDRVSQLVNSLHDGSLSIDDFDKTHAYELKQEKLKQEAAAAKASNLEKERAEMEARKKGAKIKVDEIMARKAAKDRARARFEAHAEGGTVGTFVSSNTDYAAWELWCPSDDEDEMIQNLTPNDPAFKVMEKDIDERHARMKDKMKTAMKMKEAGNIAFKAGQYTEAYKNYEAGLDADKRVIELQANAAMASLKIGCPVQAIEHCDQVMRLAEFLLEQPNHPLVPKAYHRRATAHVMLSHFKLAVADFERALERDPTNKEIKQQLAKARASLAEQDREKQIKKKVASAANKDATSDIDTDTMQKLGKIEKLVRIIKPRKVRGPAPPESGKENDSDSTNQVSTPDSTSGPQTKSDNEASANAPAEPRKAASGRRAEVQAACEELAEIMRNNDECQIYLRTCHGLEALCKQFLGAEDEVGPLCALPVLKALHVACFNDTNQEVVLADRNFLCSTMQLLKRTEVEPATAAIRLLHVCTSAPSSRKSIVDYFSTGKESIQPIIGLLKSKDPVVQANTLGLLSNCALEKAMRKALKTSEVDTDLVSQALQLMTSTLTPIVESAVTFVANLCNDSELRNKIAENPATVPALVRFLPQAAAKKAPQGMGLGVSLEPPKSQKTASVKSTISPTLLKGALAALSNCLLSDTAQDRFVLEGGVARLVPLLENSTNVTLLRTLSILSRALRKLPGVQEFRQVDGVVKAVTSWQTIQSKSPQAQPIVADAVSAETDEDTQLVEGFTRLFAVCTSVDKSVGLDLVRCAGLSMLLGVVADKRSSDVSLGNAALCIADSSTNDLVLSKLSEADAVPSLIEVAHKRKGPCCKNAGIALARMSRDPKCMERLRELHGIEIIYNYVKP